MKNVTKEIFWIVLLSALFGLIYNFFAESPLPMTRKKMSKDAIEDSVLFQPNAEAGSDYLKKTVTYSQVEKLLEKPDVLFIDARSPQQYAEGHIDDAINAFPLSDDKMEYLDKLNQLPRDKIIIVYCEGFDCDLSDMVAKDLHEFGYKQSFLYEGGWEDWNEKRF